MKRNQSFDTHGFKWILSEEKIAEEEKKLIGENIEADGSEFSSHCGYSAKVQVQNNGYRNWNRSAAGWRNADHLADFTGRAAGGETSQRQPKSKYLA